MFYYIRKKLFTAFALLLITISAGVTGFTLLSPESTVLDALYMTIITLSTVGFEEVIDLNNNSAGRIFVMLLILFGVGNILYVVSAITSFITDGDIQKILKKRRVIKMIEKINNHFIVCGSGCLCRKIIQELIETKRQFVFVSNSNTEIEACSQANKNFLFVEGDPSRNETLLSAGIKSARGLMIALEDDRDCLLVGITAKALNPDVRIVASVSEPEDIEKFKTVGIDTIVSPTIIGGLRIVSEMIRPSVTSFLDIMLRDKTSNTRFEEVTVRADSPLINQSVSGSRIKEETDLNVVSLRKPDREGFIYNPSAKEILTEGTTLIVIGGVEEIGKLRKLANEL